MITPIKCAKLQQFEYRKRNGYPNWTTLESDKYDTQFFIYKEKSGEVVICFAPSNSLTDWKSNFHFWKKPYKDMDTLFYVHSGFLQCWKEVRHYIEDEVSKLDPQSITVTGWSYGGAIAILCKEDMEFLYPDLLIRCITFGAPRVIGWYNWDKIKGRWNNTYLFKNGSDIVTTVPLLSMLFKHVSSVINIGESVRVWNYLNPLNYHQITSYIETLNRITTGYEDRE